MGFIIFCIIVGVVIYSVKKESKLQTNSNIVDISIVQKHSETMKSTDNFFDKLKQYFRDKGLLICHNFDYPINALIDEINLSGLDEKILQDYLKQTRLQNYKDELEFLLDVSLSEEKLNVKESNLVDISIIDDFLQLINDKMPVTTAYLNKTYDSAYKNQFSREDLKFEIEDELEGVNSYYGLQIQEANKLFSFGIKSFEKYNSEDEKIIVENLKYYSKFSSSINCENLNKYFLNNDISCLETFMNRVLKNSIYPQYIKKDFKLEFDKTNNTLIVNYIFPTINDIPNIEKIKYVTSQGKFVETFVKEKKKLNLYENILYQIIFRTNYELYYSDVHNTILEIVFNGWIPSVDAYGNENSICILSMKTKKNDFLENDIIDNNFKAYFKKFKGIGCIGFEQISPIKPVLNFSKEDKRFIDSYSVVKDLNKGFNLATMDWQDFENLIREVFEKEFGQVGGEVKVTQSSRDGGVDAIVFDPDPFRGGKIVIQAKRYTNVVGVSAVRDLYGTVLNEGAIKGILVTTADFGSDSYAFAKDKPLILISGAELLKLLNKQGYSTYIDLEEAKEILYS